MVNYKLNFQINILSNCGNVLFPATPRRYTSAMIGQRMKMSSLEKRIPREKTEPQNRHRSSKDGKESQHRSYILYREKTANLASAALHEKSGARMDSNKEYSQLSLPSVHQSVTSHSHPQRPIQTILPTNSHRRVTCSQITYAHNTSPSKARH